MFYVHQENGQITTFQRFVDAWLFVTLECDCFATILEQDGDTWQSWTINPAYDPNKPPIH